MHLTLKQICFSLFVLFQCEANAQYLFGQIVDDKDIPLSGAVVAWSGTTVGAMTDSLGEFELPILSIDTSKMPLRLACTYGSARDTFTIDDLHSYWTLKMAVKITLQQVTILDAATGAYISVLQPIKTEIINRAELRKAACCDLAGCFETQSTVQPTTTNILTNARELRILGLSGVYNQVLVDGLPTIQGLTYTYGTGTIPGSMLENIWVVKGANSVQQGYESMVGQITIFPREGGTAEPYTADILLNSFGEKHLNAAVAANKKKWTNYLALHTSLPGQKWDQDGDSYLNLPLLTRYAVYNKWRFRKENEMGFSAFVGARLVKEQRIGGQKTFNAETDRGTTRAYGQTVEFLQPEIFTKAGYRFSADRKMVLLAAFSGQEQDAWFGLTQYTAGQRNVYANVQYEHFWGKTKVHELKIGASYRHFRLNEQIAFAAADTLHRSFAGNYRKAEDIPGAFVENTFHLDKDRWVIIAGVRVDHHNQFGAYLVPRGMIRFNPNPNLDLRASVGRGWRTVNLFSENTALLVSNRDLVFEENLQPEKAWNAGFNATKRFKTGSTAWTASGDIYHTRFQNQFFPDYDSNPNLAIISNFTQKSVSNGIQLELTGTWSRTLEARAAYNFLDVFRVIEAEKRLLPFNPRHKLLGAITLRTPNEYWQFDVNTHWYGQQRLPDTRLNPNDLQRPDYADAYSVTNVQLRWNKLKQWDFFAGCENVFNFRQNFPILGWERPFSRGFDPSFAWGPMRGREFYIGCNFKIDRKDDKE